MTGPLFAGLGFSCKQRPCIIMAIDSMRFVTIPIPGFKTPKQIMENAKAMEFGSLTREQMIEIDQLFN
jgi:aryl-alcohol dehydrogenase-like predicted oxidoreductase